MKLSIKTVNSKSWKLLSFTDLWNIFAKILGYATLLTSVTLTLNHNFFITLGGPRIVATHSLMSISSWSANPQEIVDSLALRESSCSSSSLKLLGYTTGAAIVYQRQVLLSLANLRPNQHLRDFLSSDAACFQVWSDLKDKTYLKAVKLNFSSLEQAYF